MNEQAGSIPNLGGRMKFLGILTLAFGLLAIAAPWVAGQALLWLVGVLVMAGGLARMIWAFQAGTLGKGILVFLIGVLTLLAGILVISHPLLTSAVLSVVLAIYFVGDGIAELFAAGTLPQGQQGKGWLIFGGLVSLILGVMIFTGFPLAGVVAIGVFLGIKLLFAGMTMLTLGSAEGRLAAA
jgi:uncharacterized membrane protein HdeD (DUF308 family)